MRLNADIIYHNLKQALNVEIYGMCENDLVLHRPEFYLDRTSRFEANHVYVCSADHLPAEPVIEDNVLLICLGDAPQRDRFEQHCGILSVSGDEDIFRVFNIVQSIFNKYEMWEADLNEILRRGASLQELLDAGGEIFGNPMLLIGSDFRLLAYTEGDYLQERLGIRLDGPTFDPDLLETFLSLHEPATDIREPLLLTLMGRSTLSVNFFDVDEFLGCITVFGEYRAFRSSDLQLSRYFAEILRQAFLLRPGLAGDRASVRDAIRSIIRGEPISQEQQCAVRRYGARGGMVCASFLPAPGARPLPNGYISSLIEQQYPNALAFEHDGRVTAILPAPEAQTLTPLLRKLRLVCGVSHVFADLHDAAFSYYQAASALELGMRSEPDREAHLFEDCILPLLLKNATADIPARFFYSEGLLRLAAHDAAAPVSYLDTLKVYLDCSMSVAETARRLHLHRSSLIDRLERITQILDCDLKDPERRLAIQIVLFAGALLR